MDYAINILPMIYTSDNTNIALDSLTFRFHFLCFCIVFCLFICYNSEIFLFVVAVMMYT